ncbi:MAG: hypothetical protein K5867_06990 [Bacteroidales bacterium]|nr:hypothetical protein [Bacteroidales bacterium]
MEKKTIIVITLIMATLALTSCQTEEAKVRDVAYKYSYAMGNYDVEEAERYATDETIETTMMLAQAFLKELDTSYIASDTPATIVIDSVSMETDTSATTYCTKNTPIKHDMKFKVQLRKRKGKWLAHDPLYK